MHAALLVFAALIVTAGCARKDAANTDASDAPSTSVSSAAVSEADIWIDESVKGFSAKRGFLTVFADQAANKVYAVFPPVDDEGVSLRAIYAAGLTSGLGSNPVGLDRGLFDGGSLIAFRRVGDKLIAEQENWTYRATTDNALERRAVRESFARSFIWAGDVEATGPAGESLVDISSFLTRDALGVVKSLKDNPKGGSYSIAEDRTFADAANALAFPDNVEFDSFLTLVSDAPGDEVWATAADGRAITLVQHHSLVRLPDSGYKPRAFDVRSGAIDVPYYDFSAPLAGSIQQSFARRFRLEKQDPAAATGPVKNPIIFYVDSGAPPQIRDALIEGASWWAQAFEAAGFENAYRVEPLPAGVHPRDIRYNIISWTHRQTRGWSYGGGVSDPRTGEMIKGSVILGSQRVRQDRMIFEGLAGAQNSGKGGANDPVELALSRIRQLAAHEVGHALGFAHNFAASTNNRASVMDYPAPLVTVGEGDILSFDQAYATGVGSWDKVAANWLYREFPSGVNERGALNKILSDAYGSGLRFVADSEARSTGTGHPYASVWDNGEDAVKALEDTMAVRSIALRNFGANSIATGEPIAKLRQVIVPIYLYHRYQVAAAAKLVGGYEFSYKTKGDALSAGSVVADDKQRAALAALMKTLAPSSLVLPPRVLDQLTQPMGVFNGRGGGEVFSSGADPMFDLASAAEAASSLTIDALLHPARAARLIEQQRRNPSALGFGEVLNAIDNRVFAPATGAGEQEIANVTQNRFVSSLIELALNDQAQPGVRALTEAKLRAIANRLEPSLFSGQQARTQNAWLQERIEAHLNRPAASSSAFAPAVDIPSGSPIGAAMMETCWHCEGLGD
ncbi:zinc-dependent metalloprotease [Hyphococcus sp.]|uniref:zinc-dependent metalloprotease n=1 Tax=Hyphococcus sp. TaxID=2038636 RepID=UPI00208CB0E1|nr:MAG: peptidase [Marinicaulis sp.]